MNLKYFVHKFSDGDLNIVHNVIPMALDHCPPLRYPCPNIRLFLITRLRDAQRSLKREVSLFNQESMLILKMRGGLKCFHMLCSHQR